jgi:Protein of unknown function (DUF1559)
MKPLIVACLMFWSAIVLRAAPVPKSAPDPRKDADSTAPVEPAVDPEKLPDNLVLAVQDRANRAKSTNNLKQIVLAVHNYHDANGRLPANVVGKDGEAILSWRVQLLPYLEHERLYKQFKFDEPWNGPNNIQLVEQMPKFFESPRAIVKRKGYTVYQSFAGKGCLFRPDHMALRMTDITDGLSNTFFAVEASTAVPWTKPADIPFDAEKDLPDFGKVYGHKPVLAMCDGSVRVLDLKKVDKEMIKRAVTVADGMPVALDEK